MAVSDAARNIAWTLRRHGLLATLLLIREAVWPASYRLCLFGLTPGDARLLPPLPEALEDRVASRQEVESLRGQGQLSPGSIERFERGDRCLLQFISGRLAGLGWLATRPEVELGPSVRLRVPDDAGYSYRSWTDPEYRGRGLQARRALSFLRMVQAEGRGRLLLFVQRASFESLKGVRKAGYRPIGWIDVRERPGSIRWRITISDPAWSEVIPEGADGRVLGGTGRTSR